MTDTYKKLVDLYAGRELTEELDSELETAAMADPELKAEMASLRKTVDSLKAGPDPEFTEESYQRILLKVYARGIEMQKQSPDPVHLQYHLPMQG
jgi:anti-sigma factor RsiW